MTAVRLEGAPLAARVRERVALAVAELGRLGLATVLVGDDPASQVYIRRKHEACRAVGIEPRDCHLPAETTEDELIALIEELNADDAIDGILVQLPLPGHIDERRVIRTIDPVKDVDGLTPTNAGSLVLGEPLLVPATPLGVLELLDAHGVELEGAHAVVVGRSPLVGKPVALLLLARNATVTVCHSRTADLGEVTRQADVLVVAVGRAGLITPGMVKEGAVVIDVGMNRLSTGLVGDVLPEVAERASLLTPVPGGVGPMTVAMLLANTVRAAEQRRGLLAFRRPRA